MYIKQVSINWDKIPEESYLRNIESIRGRPMHFHKSSHGESFLSAMQNSFKGNGIYFMDEPGAALSPQRQLTLLMEIDRCRKEGAQFFIVTHSPIILGLPDAEILTFDDGIIHQCEYEETESYQVTSMFINDRKRILKRPFKKKS